MNGVLQPPPGKRDRFGRRGRTASIRTRVLAIAVGHIWTVIDSARNGHVIPVSAVPIGAQTP